MSTTTWILGAADLVDELGVPCRVTAAIGWPQAPARPAPAAGS